MNIVPIGDRQARLPEMGKLKCGEEAPIKGGRTRPAGIDVWRITSGNRDALDALQAVYGGTVRATSNAKAIHPWDLKTESPVLSVVLPPDPLGDSPIYEKFGGKGLERRCDGVRCKRTDEIKGEGGGFVTTVVPCVCIPLIERANQQGATVPPMSVCRPTTRLSVMFADIAFGGVWTLTSHSDAAASEIPGMVELIRATSGGGLQRAELRITHRQSRGGSRQYRVPVLAPEATLAGLAAGAGTLGGPTPLDLPALPSGEPPRALPGGGVGGSRAEVLVGRLRALRASGEDLDGSTYEAYQTFLREQEERSWPRVAEMDEGQLDELEAFLDEIGAD